MGQKGWQELADDRFEDEMAWKMFHKRIPDLNDRECDILQMRLLRYYGKVPLDDRNHHIYRHSGPCTEEYIGYSDPERQRPHSRYWGLSHQEMYALLRQEFRAKKGAYSDLLRGKG